MWTIGENLYVKKYPFSNETNQCGQVKENENATGWDEKGFLGVPPKALVTGSKT